jgi:hypothetical protein
MFPCCYVIKQAVAYVFENKSLVEINNVPKDNAIITVQQFVAF